MNALSCDLRRRIVSAVDGGLSQSEAARRYDVSRKTVGRLLVRRQVTGTIQAKPRPGRVRSLCPDQHPLLATQMQAHPNLSVAEHALLWQQETGQRLSATTLWRTLKRMGWSHKKRAFMPPNEMKRPDSSGDKPHET